MYLLLHVHLHAVYLLFMDTLYSGHLHLTDSTYYSVHIMYQLLPPHKEHLFLSSNVSHIHVHVYYCKCTCRDYCTCTCVNKLQCTYMYMYM